MQRLKGAISTVPPLEVQDRERRPMALLITHARLATLGQQPQIVEDGALLIEGDRIAALGTTTELATRYPAVERWDADGQMVLPASICAHTHFYGAFARGMSVPGDPAAGFPQLLQQLWWRLDKALTLRTCGTRRWCA
jgi:Cytosine deaminase and related metal-dependent hydrolases